MFLRYQILAERWVFILYEICVESIGQDDYVICWLGSDYAEALTKLEGITRLGIECCLRYFVYPEDFKEEGE